MNHVEVLVTPDRLTAIRERMLEYLGECSATWRKWNLLAFWFWKILEISKDFRGEKDHTRIQAEEVEWKEPAGMGR